tara:strand:- start:726 stop:1139 length:414 start_codon:yes stop_codon:yes gene_type:complete
MSDVKPIVVTADVYWANLNRVNEMSGKFQVELCNLSDKAVEALEELGLSIKNADNKEDQGNYITCASRNAIRAYNTDGDELKGIEVGNGSKARAVLGFYDWTFKGKAGRSPSLQKLIVDDLIVFEAATGSYDLEEAI